MTDATAKTNTKPRRNTYRPITIVIEGVRPMPPVRTLPPETQMYVNLKGNRKSGEELVTEIQRQLSNGDFFAVEVDGTS